MVVTCRRALVAPWSTPIKVLTTCLAGLTVVSVGGVPDFSARCLSFRAAAAVMGGGFGRDRLPGLWEGSLEDSRMLGNRLGGSGGLAKDVGGAALVPTAVEESVEGPGVLGGESAIKQRNPALKNGVRNVGAMVVGRKGRLKELDRWTFQPKGSLLALWSQQRLGLMLSVFTGQSAILIVQ